MRKRVSPECVESAMDTIDTGFGEENRKSSLTSRVKAFLRRLSSVDTAPKLTLHHHESLGVGGHAQVVSGTLDDRKVAVKILPSSDPSVTREIRVSSSLPSHPNVVTAGSAVASRSRHSMYLPMELCECDALAKFVERGQATPTDVIEVFRGVTAGLAHLHANGIYHLDIKPENILLSGSVAKLCDLGHCTEVLWTDCVYGTLNYAAPEALEAYKIMKRKQGKPKAPKVKFADSAEPGRPGTYDAAKADVWSLGISMFVVATKAFPWEAATSSNWRYDAWKQSYNVGSLIGEAAHGSRGMGDGAMMGMWASLFGITRMPSGYDIPGALVNLLRGMLHPDPTQRFTVQQVQAHPFLRVVERPPLPTPLPPLKLTARPSRHSNASIVSSASKPPKGKPRTSDVLFPTGTACVAGTGYSHHCLVEEDTSCGVADLSVFSSTALHETFSSTTMSTAMATPITLRLNEVGAAEGHIFVIEKRCALLSGEVRRRVTESGDSNMNEFRFPDITTPVLEQVIEYMHYKIKFDKSSRAIPPFPIDPPAAIHLLKASVALDL